MFSNLGRSYTEQKLLAVIHASLFSGYIREEKGVGLINNRSFLPFEKGFCDIRGVKETQMLIIFCKHFFKSHFPQKAVVPAGVLLEVLVVLT